jgi:ABC-2 type transport system permease protein
VSILGNHIRSELFKLRKNRSFRSLTLILLALAILYPLLIVFDGDSGVIKVNEFYMHSSLGVNNDIIKLIPCFLAGFFISCEYSIGTMKSIVASGNRRIRLYFAKLMVFSIGAIIISLIVPIVMTGVGAKPFN